MFALTTTTINQVIIEISGFQPAGRMWPVTDPSAAHQAEHNLKITFSLTIHFSFYFNLKSY